MVLKFHLYINESASQVTRLECKAGTLTAFDPHRSKKSRNEMLLLERSEHFPHDFRDCSTAGILSGPAEMGVRLRCPDH